MEDPARRKGLRLPWASKAKESWPSINMWELGVRTCCYSLPMLTGFHDTLVTYGDKGLSESDNDLISSVSWIHSVLYGFSVVDADRLSVEEESSVLNDADEGFSSGASSSSQHRGVRGRKSRTSSARRTSNTSLDCRPGAEARRCSILSLQEQRLPEETEMLLSPGKQSRSPSFNMQIISQV